MVRDDDTNEPVIKMRGLPWSATIEDIVKFLEGVNIKNGNAGVHITMSKEGRPSGEAFVELESLKDVEKAMKKNKKNMGHRYIEIFKTSRNDMDWFLEKSSSDVENVVDECCIRLRGLPYGCTTDDIIQFFSGLTIVPNSGISFVSDETGRNTGEAYVQFVNKEMVEKALRKHLDRIGHRWGKLMQVVCGKMPGIYAFGSGPDLCNLYIEIFRSSLAEIRAQTGPKIRPLMSELIPRPVPYDRSGRFGGPNRLGRSHLPSIAPIRHRDIPERADRDISGPWTGSRKLLNEPISSLTRDNVSPPPAAKIRNMMYGDVNTLNSWNEDDQQYIVHMRGLPYKATEQDIMNFFRPLIPINVQILYEKNGRPSGDANVEFESYEDARKAMSKNKQNMNNRYIELFLKTTPPINKPSSLSGRSLSGRSLSGFMEDIGLDATYSRRNSGPGSSSVSNSAYDGFYGTSLYRAASNASRF